MRTFLVQVQYSDKSSESFSALPLATICNYTQLFIQRSACVCVFSNISRNCTWEGMRLVSRGGHSHRHCCHVRPASKSGQQVKVGVHNDVRSGRESLLMSLCAPGQGVFLPLVKWSRTILVT